MVTVIIPTYNYGKFIAATLESVIAQSYTSWECVVVDDGSVDDTRERVAPYLSDPRIKYVFQQNKGLAGARNTGLLEAKGKYILFLDSDDLIEIHKLKHTVDYFEANPLVDIVYGDMRYFKSGFPSKQFFDYRCDERADAPWMPYISGKGKEIIKRQLMGNMMVVSSAIFRFQADKTPPLFNESLKANEDWDYWLRMFLSDKRIDYVDAPFCRTLIRIHEVSMSKDVFKMWSYGLKVLTTNSQRLLELGFESEWKQRVAHHRRGLLRMLRQSSRNLFEARIEFLNSLELTSILFSRPFMFEILRQYVHLKTLVYGKR